VARFDEQPWRDAPGAAGARGRRMKTVRRLFYADVVTSVVFVAMAFLSLFFFIDFVDELADIGKSGYTALHAAIYSLLQLPGHLYELSPIAVLIGTIYALARLAQSSEYTILRTGGLGPGRALGLLAGMGLMFGVLTYVVGDHVAPFTERQATLLKAHLKGGLPLGSAGAWLKDHASAPEGERSYSINVGSAPRASNLLNVRIFEFDADGRLLKRISAASAQIEEDATWALSDAVVTRWTEANGGGGSRVLEERLARLDWPSTLTAGVVAAALLPVSNMSTLELFRYIVHLADNEQAAQRHQIQFWKRALYPFSCLVMMALALPFAYMHARAGSVSLKVFGGIMLGISFVLQNNLAGHLGLLRNWTPWIVAAAPNALYLLLSLLAFAWLVRYR
jgi:lipopolysaccharide export system permease protein